MADESESNLKAPVPIGLFAATRWSVVLGARDGSGVALGTLCEGYRQPLLTWLRIRGYAPHDAEDLVQGFFAHLLSRDFLENVGKEKGAFRTFLLRCLKNYLSDQHDKRIAAKRGSGAAVESLDDTNEDGRKLHHPAAPEPAPDQEFDRAWARTVLSRACHRLEEECGRQGHAALCHEIQPVMFADETASPYHTIALSLNMTEGAVKTAAYRIRARLKVLIQEEVMETVANTEDWREEVRYLIRLFGA